IGPAQNPLPWTEVVPDDGGFALFDIKNPSFAYSTASTEGGIQLQTSSDGGLTWDQVTPTNAIASAMQNAGGLGAVFYPPVASDPAVAKRVWVGGHGVYVSTNGMASFQLQTNQDLTDAGCGDGSCALEDLEFVPGDPTRAWALAMGNDLNYSVGSSGFAVANTTQANCPDQPSCAGGQLAAWTDVTANVVNALPGVTTQTSTQATGIAVDPNHSLVAYLTLSGFRAITTIGH